MYPDHTAPSNPGLCNFLFYLFNNLAILQAISNKTADQTIHLIRVCTTSYSAKHAKHKKKAGDDSILNIGPKYLSIHCVSRSHCSIVSGSTQFSIMLFQLI